MAHWREVLMARVARAEGKVIDVGRKGELETIRFDVEQRVRVDSQAEILAQGRRLGVDSTPFRRQPLEKLGETCFFRGCSTAYDRLSKW